MNKAFDFNLPGYLPEETTNENEDSFDSDYSDIEESKEDDTSDNTNDKVTNACQDTFHVMPTLFN